MLVSQGLLLLLICGTHGHLQEFFGFKDVVPPVAVPVNVPSSSLSSLLCTSSSTICYRDNIRLCVNQQPIDTSAVVHTCTYGCSSCENGPHICNDEKGNSRCAQANSDRFVKECSPEQQGKSFCSGGDVRYCNSSNLAVLVEYCDARGCQSDPLSCHEPAVRQTRSLLQKAKGKTMVQMSSTNTTTTNSTIVSGAVSNSAASSSAGANSNANSNANNAAAMTGASSGSGNGNAWNSASAMGSGNGMTNSSTSTTVTSTAGGSSQGAAAAGGGSAPNWNINMNAPSTAGKARTIVTTNSTTVVTNTTTITSSASSSSSMMAMASNCSGVDTTQPLLRVEWASMPDADRLRYINAVRALYAQGGMQQLAQLHYNNRQQIYGTGVSHFLIWHRAFLNDFEQRLRALPGYGCVTVPFWTYDYSGQPLDRRSLFGTNATKLGQAAQPGCLGGAFANVTQSLNGSTSCVTRNPNPALLAALSGSQFTDLIQLDQSDFGTFSDDLQTIQGLPHVALGGFMTTQWSPIDPAFFVHHANVDRLWSMWQDCHQNYQWSEPQGLQQPIAGYSGVTAGDFINNSNINWKGQRQSVQYEANAIGNPAQYSSDFRRRIVTSCQSNSMLISQVSPIIGVDSWASALRGQAGPIMHNVTLSCNMNTNMTGLNQLPRAPVAVYDNVMLQDCVMLCGSFYFKNNGTSNCACTTFSNGGVSNVSLGAAMNWFSANCGNGSTYGFYQSVSTNSSTNGRRLLQTQQQRPGLTLTTQNSGATTIASTPQAGNGVSTSMGSASSGGSTSMGISTSSTGVTTSTSSASNGSSSSVASAGAPAPTPKAAAPAAAATTVSVRNVTNVTTTVTNVTRAAGGSSTTNNNNNNNAAAVAGATATNVTSSNSSATRSVVIANANNANANANNAPVTNVTSTNTSVTTVNTTVANSNANVAPVAAAAAVTNSNSQNSQNSQNMMMNNNNNNNNGNSNANAASSGSSEESSSESSSASSSESSMSSNEASMEGSGESVVTTVTTTNVTNVTIVQKQLILSPPPAVCFVSYASMQRIETACSSQASSPVPLPRDWLLMNNLNPDNANVCNLFVPANGTVTSNCVWSYD